MLQAAAQHGVNNQTGSYLPNDMLQKKKVFLNSEEGGERRPRSTDFLFVTLTLSQRGESVNMDETNAKHECENRMEAQLNA